MLASEIAQRVSKLESDRQNVDAQRQAVENFILPYRGQFFQGSENESTIDWNKRDVYDSTAVVACQSLAATIHAALTPGGIQWFGRKFRNPQLSQDHDAKVWLSTVTDTEWEEIQKSNFNTEIGEKYLDLVGFGDGFIMLEELTDAANRYDGVEFTAIPVKEAFFDMGAKSRLLNFYRKMQRTPLWIRDKFGDQTPASIIQKIDANDNNKVTVIFCIYRRTEIPLHVGVDSILAPQARPFGYKYVVMGSEGGAEDCGTEGGYYEMPVFGTRFGRTSGSQWGHGPGMVALGDTLSLNQAVKLTLAALEKAIDPPMKTTERGLLSDLDLRAAGLNVVRSMDDLAVLDNHGRFDVGQMKIEDMRRSIRAYFHVDQLELKDSPQMTATEVNVRYELMQRHLSPMVGHIYEECFDPLLERLFRILYRAKKLPPLPDSVKKIGGEIDISYVGPLSRAQQYDTVAGITQWVQGIGALAQINKDILDNVDFDAIAKITHGKLSVPEVCLRADGDKLKVRKERQAREDAAAQAQIGEMRGNAVKATGQGVKALNEAQQGPTQ